MIHRNWGLCLGGGQWTTVHSRGSILVRLFVCWRRFRGKLDACSSPRLTWWVNKDRKLVHLGDNGQGRLIPWFTALSERLARVRVCSGDWSRVCGPSVTFKHGLTGVFLDPPYADTATRQSNLYREDSESVAHAVRVWALANGDNPLMRIALCGYEGEHEMPDLWSVYRWSAGAGFGGQAVERSGNGERERVWFSPHCLSSEQGDLFMVREPYEAEVTA